MFHREKRKSFENGLNRIKDKIGKTEDDNLFSFSFLQTTRKLKKKSQMKKKKKNIKEAKNSQKQSDNDAPPYRR